MKAVRDARVFASLILPWLAVSCGSIDDSYKTATSPEVLLRSILAHADEGDYDAVASLVYPLELAPGVTMPALVVAAMKSKPPTQYVGDFSYSGAALRVLLQEHMNDFRRPTEREALAMGLVEGGRLMDDSLLALTYADPNSFRILWRGKCRVVLLHSHGAYRLVFWEGLNSLL